jgi:hypothetical protein
MPTLHAGHHKIPKADALRANPGIDAHTFSFLLAVLTLGDQPWMLRTGTCKPGAAWRIDPAILGSSGRRQRSHEDNQGNVFHLSVPENPARI